MKSLVSTGFKKYAEDKFFSYCEGVVLSMTSDPQFVSMKADVENAKALLTDFKNHTLDPNAGGALYYAQKTVKKEAVVAQFELLAKLMDIFAKDDIILILASGHESNTGSAARTAYFGAPTDITVAKGDRSGSALIKWKDSGVGKHYNIEWRLKGGEQWIGNYSCGLRSYTIQNFELRTVIEVRVQTVAKDGTKSEWSAPAEYWVTP